MDFRFLQLFSLIAQYISQHARKFIRVFNLNSNPLFLWLSTILRKIFHWLLQRPAMVVYTVIAVLLCLGNYFISSFLSNELIIRKIDGPYLQLSKLETPLNLSAEKSVGCMNIADRIQTLINAKPSTQFAQESEVYCGFLTDNYALEIDFPYHSPEQIPRSRFVNISNKVVYTVFPNYGFYNPDRPVFVPVQKKCSVLMMIGRPVIVSVMYPNHPGFPCGTAQGISQYLVNHFLM